MTRIPDRLFNWCHRYISVTFIAIVILLIFVLFFTENSVMRSIELSHEINDIKSEIRDYRDSARHYERLNHELSTDPETLEKIVRENYHMQRPNEDVYIIKSVR